MEIKIPIGVNIQVDDVGWQSGADERHLGRPSRSGLPRRHHPNDVLAVNEIGKRLGTKILCNLVLGEWDKNNRLRGVPHFTWDAKGWDAAAKLDMTYTEAYLDALEGSEYIDYGLHSLLHSYYDDNGNLLDLKICYPFVRKNAQGVCERYPLSNEEFALMVDLFYQIYDDWGFKKKISVFESPCGCIGTPDSDYNRDFARILYPRGIRVWQWAGWPEEAMVREGMTYLQCTALAHEWNAYDFDPEYHYDAFLKEGMHSNLCGHLTNFIRFHPEKNFEYVDKWVAYFRRLTSHYGAVLAQDALSSASQSLYANYATLAEGADGTRVDLAPVLAQGSPILMDELFVSAKGTLTSCQGGTLTHYEARPDHNVYRVTLHQGATSIVVK